MSNRQPYIALLVSILILLVFGTLFLTHLQETEIRKATAAVPERFARAFAVATRTEVDDCEKTLKAIAAQAPIQAAWLARDKKALSRQLLPLLPFERRPASEIRFTFLTLDGSVFFHTGREESRTAPSDNLAWLKARDHHAPAWHLELDRQKRYRLSVVLPWYRQGKLLGYLQCHRSLYPLVSRLARVLQLRIYFALDKKQIADAPAAVRENVQYSRQTLHHVIAFSTYSIPDVIGAILEGTFHANTFTFLGRRYAASTLPIPELGSSQWVLLSDVSLIASLHQTLSQTFLIFLGLLGLSLALPIALIFRRSEHRYQSLISDLKAREHELHASSLRFKKLFDIQKSLVVVTDAYTPRMGNQALLKFFGLRDLEELIAGGHALCDRFIQDEGLFHTRNLPQGTDWIKEIQKRPKEKRIVGMEDHYGDLHVFTVNISQAESGEFIVVFADISATAEAQNQLKYKVFHDPLTGVNNREFFTKNIRNIIERTSTGQLGVLLCDADDFKQINDTWGHLVGDTVLKELATTLRQSLRKEDYVIRWGGEEFVVLIQTRNPGSLTRTADHLRRTIEEHFAPTPRHVTCSFGGTLYRPEDASVMDAVERADRALYRAKESGKNTVVIA